MRHRVCRGHPPEWRKNAEKNYKNYLQLLWPFEIRRRGAYSVGVCPSRLGAKRRVKYVCEKLRHIIDVIFMSTLLLWRDDWTSVAAANGGFQTAGQAVRY